MGSAILSGILAQGMYAPQNVCVYDKYAPAVQRLVDQYGIAASQDIEGLFAASDVILFAIKPNVLASVLAQVQPLVGEACDKLFISIVAGWGTPNLQAGLGNAAHVVRVMPNTPAMVGAGMAAISLDTQATAEELQIVQDIFCALGKACLVQEKDMDAVTGVSGSGPAYAYMFIEAMADAAVLEGLPRDVAYLLSAQTLLGSAKMVLDTGEHPGLLKDRVCSPGGTTIQGVQALEDGGLRATIMDAVCRATQRSRELG